MLGCFLIAIICREENGDAISFRNKTTYTTTIIYEKRRLRYKRLKIDFGAKPAIPITNKPHKLQDINFNIKDSYIEIKSRGTYEHYVTLFCQTGKCFFNFTSNIYILIHLLDWDNTYDVVRINVDDRYRYFE